MTAAGAGASMLVIVGLGIGAAGLVLLGQGSSAGVALVSVALMGVGLSLPYPLYYDEAERVLPDRPVGSLGLMQVGAGLFPIPVIPLFGAALASGDADLPSPRWRPSLSSPCCSTRVRRFRRLSRLRRRANPPSAVPG
jgi:hypothetical protein